MIFGNKLTSNCHHFNLDQSTLFYIQRNSLFCKIILKSILYNLVNITILHFLTEFKAYFNICISNSKTQQDLDGDIVAQLFEKKLFADIVFNIEGKEISAHKVIIENSDYLWKLFTSTQIILKTYGK